MSAKKINITGMLGKAIAEAIKKASIEVKTDKYWKFNIEVPFQISIYFNIIDISYEKNYEFKKIDEYNPHVCVKGNAIMAIFENTDKEILMELPFETVFKYQDFMEKFPTNITEINRCDFENIYKRIKK